MILPVVGDDLFYFSFSLVPVWLFFVFLIGTAVGSFLNVCIYRLPLEKSLLWPGSRCGKCLQPIRWYHNLPLLSYLWLRGRCGTCGARYSMRYFFIELFTGLAFAGLFYLEIIANVHNLRLFQDQDLFIRWGVIPWQGLAGFAYHAILLSFLIVVTFSDIDHMEIPLPITLTGMVVGLIGSALFPWPWPDRLDDGAWWKQPALHFTTATVGARLPRPALFPWPVWNELPSWVPLGSHLSGLAAGLAGVVAAMVILRGIAFLFKTGRGKEGLGLGDADLMMMVGSFLGWQAVVIAFFVSVGPALILGIAQLIFRGDRPFPFGPSLALGSILTMLGWNWFWQKMGPTLANFFFDGPVLSLTISVGAVVMFVLFWMLGAVRGREPAPEPEKVMIPAPEPPVEDKVTTAEPPPP